MKKEIHPQMYDVVYVDSSSGAQFISTSTEKSEETATIDGKEYFVIKVDISSDTHPFYTGKQKLIDEAGRIEKFEARRAKAVASSKKPAKAPKKADDSADDADGSKEEPSATEKEK